MIIINPYRFTSAPAPPSTLLTGLTASYSLNGNANKNVGTYDGTATNVTYGTGDISGQCGVFNGTAKVSILNSSDFNLSNNDWAHFIRFKRSTINSRQVLFGKSNPAGQTSLISIWLEFDSSNFLTFYIVKSDLNFVTLVSSSAVTDTNWHTVTIIRNSGTVTMYLDATQVATDNTLSSSLINNPTGFLSIGAAGDFGSLLFNGNLQDFHIWNGRYLTSSEITELQTKRYPF